MPILFTSLPEKAIARRVDKQRHKPIIVSRTAYCPPDRQMIKWALENYSSRSMCFAMPTLLFIK